MFSLSCRRDICACFLGILISIRSGSLLAVGFILCTTVFFPAVVGNSLHRCRVYVIIYGGFPGTLVAGFVALVISAAVKNTVDSVGEVIAQFLEEDSWLVGRV